MPTRDLPSTSRPPRAHLVVTHSLTVVVHGTTTSESSARDRSMNRVLQLPLGAGAPPGMESYTLGDVLICKANRGKQLEVETLVKTLYADVNYRNQVQWTAASADQGVHGRG